LNRSANIINWLKDPFSVQNWGNWKVIVLCISAATIFWFFNALNKDYTTSINYPVGFLYDHDQFIATKPVPEEIQINVSGGGWNLIRRSGFFNTRPIIINLENPAEQKQISGNSLRATLSDQLTEFKLNFVVTDTVYLSITNRIKKKFPIIVDSLAISMRNDYRIISNISAAIDSVEIDGPDEYVMALPDSIIIKPIDDDIDDNFNEEISITLQNPLLIAIPSEINVQFLVARFVRITKDFVIQTKNFPPDSTLLLENPIITLSFIIQNGIEDQILDEDFSIVADLQRMVMVDSTIQPLIKKYPAYISNIEMESGRVKVVQ
jgi:hypothetical protein